MRGIFAWLVEGYRKYLKDGLTMSAAMQKVISQYEKDNDLILQFLEDRCERDDGSRIKVKDLYGAYKIWCKSNGYYIATLRKFRAGTEAHPEWVDLFLKDGYQTYKGVKLKE